MTTGPGHLRTVQVALAVVAVMAVVIFAVLRTSAVVVEDRGACLWLSYDAMSWYSYVRPFQLVGIGVVQPQEGGSLTYHDLTGTSVVFDASGSCE